MITSNDLADWEHLKLYFDDSGISSSTSLDSDTWIETWALTNSIDQWNWVLMYVYKEKNLFSLEFPNSNCINEEIHLDTFSDLDEVMFYIIDQISTHFDENNFITKDKNLSGWIIKAKLDKRKKILKHIKQ